MAVALATIVDQTVAQTAGVDRAMGIPLVCWNWATAKRDLSLFANDRVSEADILSGPSSRPANGWWRAMDRSLRCTTPRRARLPEKRPKRPAHSYLHRSARRRLQALHISPINRLSPRFGQALLPAIMRLTPRTRDKFLRRDTYSLVKPTTGQFTRIPVVLTRPPPGLTNRPASLLAVRSSPSVMSFR